MNDTVKETDKMKNVGEVGKYDNNIDNDISCFSKITSKLRVDRYMLPAKISYFFIFGKEGSFLPFVVPFLIGIGLSPGEAGLINGIRLIGLIIGAPIWGFVTDKNQNHKCILLVLIITSIILIGGQPFISTQISKSLMNRCPYDKVTLNSTVPAIENPEKSYRSTLFLVMLLINIIASFFDGSSVSIVDSGVVQRINAAKIPKDFGWNRLFGAIGFSAGSLLSGVATDNFPTLNVTCFSGAYFSYVVYSLGVIVISRFLYLDKSHLKRKDADTDCDDDKKKGLIRKKIFEKLRNVENLMFFATVFILGMLQGINMAFTGLKLKELHAPSFLIGLTFSVAAISCLPTFSFSSFFIKLFGGLWNTLFICCLSYVLRFFTFAFITNQWLALPIHSLQCIGFALTIVSGITFVKNIAEPIILTTMVSLFNTMHFGVGFVAANVIGGQIYNRYKGTVLFACFGGCAASWCMVLIVFGLIKKLKGKKEETKTSVVDVLLQEKACGKV